MGKNKKHERKKINLIFDEDKRKDFLCGFRKRKLERKKKAQEELQQLLKAEKKRIKLENKESYKKLVVSSRPIPDIEQLLREEYEDEDVNVKIVELSSDTLEKRDLVIGENKPKELPTKKQANKIKNHKNVEVPGMGSEEENSLEETVSDSDEKDSKLKTKKEIKRMLKNQATKKVQKSKVFQMKSKLDRVKNKKKSHQKQGRIAIDNNKNKRKQTMTSKQGRITKDNKNKRKQSGKKTVGRRKH